MMVSLCIAAGVLVEAPVMLALVKIANKNRQWLPVKKHE